MRSWRCSLAFFPALLCVSIAPCSASFQLFATTPRLFEQHSFVMMEHPGTERADRKKEDQVIDDDQDAAALEFCRLIGRLKITPRTGWVRRQVPGYESVADHSWRVAAMAGLLFADVPRPLSTNSNGGGLAEPSDDGDNDSASNHDPVNGSLEHFHASADTVLMALVHDLAECIVGDIPPEDQVVDKHDREATAMQTIAQLLQRAGGSHRRLSTAFRNYEARSSPQSRLVKDLDGLDMILQADEYESRYGMDNLDDFFQPRTFHNVKVQRLVQRILRDREERKARLAKVHSSSSTSETRSDTNSDAALRTLSLADQAFVEEHGKASPLSNEAIRNVVLALRQWEKL
jgi:5'-deoxynucleotidase YfbR-like HD superfamily hydrolase